MNIPAFYTDILHVTDPSLIQIMTAYSEEKQAKKGEIIQNIGDPTTHIYFLVHGLLRGFFFDVKGHEITDCFGFYPGTPAISCFNLNEPAMLCIEAMEDSTYLAVQLDVLLELLTTNHALMELYNRLLRGALQTHWEYKSVMIRCTATERYLWFLDKFSALVDRVSDKYIASFLGMTPVSLSRIRRAIREEKYEWREEY